MANYLVSYDLDQPGAQSHARIKTRLLESKAIQVLSNQWLMKFPGDIFAVEKDLLACIDAADRLLIVPIEQGRNAWSNLRIGNADFKAWVSGV